MSFNTNKFFSTMQTVGKSLMTPVSVLPAAGLLVAIGRMVENTLPGKLMFSGGIAIFEQLPVVFAIGVAIGFTEGAGVAGLSSAIGYYTLVNVLKVMKEYRMLGVDINTGVFGGIIIGLLASYLYKKFHEIKLHPVLGFFSGKRFVPIITATLSVFVGIILSLIWPPIQAGINSFGHFVMSSEFGPAFYAAGKRLLIPVGLHHVYYPPFLYEFGEFVSSSGAILKGETARYFAGDPTAGRFMAAEFPIMLFGLPAASFAMFLKAKKDRKAAIAGIMITAALTSIITGITEPIEFAFIFVAPILYVFHVLAAFGSGLLTGYFDIHLGYTFSASLIDFVVGASNMKNSWALWLIVGPLIGLLYFGVFYFLIGLMDLKTPGREIESDSDSELDKTPIDSNNKAAMILNAIGGERNIVSLDACITRLRLIVVDSKNVNQEQLKKIGASGIMSSGTNFQIIFGVESDSLKDQIKKIIKNSKNLMQEGVLNLLTPMVGERLVISEVPDPTFATEVLGKGFAINPTEGIVYAPFSGKVTQVFRTKHAIGLTSNKGIEILIHVGIDTVKMNGEGFNSLVSKGDTIIKGQKILEFDLELVKNKAKSTITPIIFTNSDKIKKFNYSENKLLKANDEIANLELN